MKTITLLFYLCLSILSFGSINISPYNFDFNLKEDMEREYTLVNTGEFLASYTIELEKKTPISQYLDLKKERFVLKPGERRNFKIFVKNKLDGLDGEHIGKLYILEQQKLKNMNYEINTAVNLYGYIGEVKEKFEIETIIKDEDNLLIGEIKNNSRRKVDIMLRGIDSKKIEIFSKKIRVLRGQKYELLNLGNLDELVDVKIVEIESKDMKKVFEI